MNSEKGSNLLEVLVGSGILAIIGVVFLVAITSSINGAGIVQDTYSAENLLQTQIEDIKSLPYDETGDYPAITCSQSNLTASVTVIDESPPEYPNTLQKITITIHQDGKQLLTIETYKAKL